MRTVKAFAFAILAVTLVAPHARAQTGTAPDPSAMAQMMAMIEPGPEHQHLARMVGKWKVAGKMWMDPAAPPTDMGGTMEYVSALGGRFIEGHFNSVLMGQPFEGLSVDGYDRFKKEYNSFWFDSMGTGYLVMSGPAPAAGQPVVLRGTMFEPMSGQNLPVRSVTTRPDNNTIHFEMFATSGGRESKSMDLVYTRQ